MAKIESVKLRIAPSADLEGYSVISYSYELHPDDADAVELPEFTVAVGLWGQDVLDDDVLDTDLDQHTVRLSGATPRAPVGVERVFEVETKLLNEDLTGNDEVFLLVEARSGNDRVSGRSNTVVGDF
ncbi:MAG TPA: hypothetical protein VFG48_06140 [Xanthomonadales bacterium]|nr:hypothetical protein [Xanthomonadales bacterium]